MYAIQYHYPGTVNGEPVGLVYALDIGHLSSGSWSYTKDILKATTFRTAQEAERTAASKTWPEAKIVTAT